MNSFLSATKRSLPHFSKSYLSTMSGLSLTSVVAELNRFAPLSLAEPWDNVGLLIEPTKPTIIHKMLLTNDLTPEVMNEAVDAGANLIYSYHPPIFAPLKRITATNWKEQIVATCLENKIALYSPHTCLDALDGGVNDWLAQAFQPLIEKCEPITTSISPVLNRNCTHMVELPLPFSPEGKKVVREILELVGTIPDARIEEHISTADGYEQVTVLTPEKYIPSIIKLVKDSPFANSSRSYRIIRLEKPPIPGTGAGRIVQLSTAISVEKAVELVKFHLKLANIRLARSSSAEIIKTVALCAGSGASVLKNVKADLYLTGEMSHHEVLDAVQRGSSVILSEHSNSERGFLVPLSQKFSELFEGKIEIIVSAVDRDPLLIV